MWEFLFRGKEEHIHRGKEIGRWIQGGYAPMEGRNGYKFITQYDEGGLVGLYTHTFVFPDSVGMWTGLETKGKNPRKVFTGDIISHISGQRIGVVRIGRYRQPWGNCDEIGFYVEWINVVDKDFLRKDLVFWIEERDCKIIGNEHDNKELLIGGE